MWEHSSTSLTWEIQNRAMMMTAGMQTIDIGGEQYQTCSQVEKHASHSIITYRHRDCVRLLNQHSPGAQIFCLLHKMDLVESSRRRSIYLERAKELKVKGRELGVLPTQLHCCGTSIWDETLYRAWSRIVHSLIPNVSTLESNLTQFAKITAATEAVIFERNTFLVVARSGDLDEASAKSSPQAKPRQVSTSSATSSTGLERSANLKRGSQGAAASAVTAEEEEDIMEGYPPSESERKSMLEKGQMHPERFEKISELVKNMRGSCNKLQMNFHSFEVRGETFSAYLDVFTSDTYILVIVADPTVGE